MDYVDKCGAMDKSMDRAINTGTIQDLDCMEM